MEYFADVAARILLFGLLAIALDLSVGHLGRISVAHAGLFGIGSYTVGILTTSVGVSWPLAVLLGGLLSGASALLLALVADRVSSDSFVLVTLAAQLVVTELFLNLRWLTGGALGIPGIPPPRLLGLTLDSTVAFAILGVLIVAAALVLVGAVVGSHFGLVLHGLREDAVFMAVAGKRPSSFFHRAFALSGALAGLSGGLYALYIGFIEPSTFTLGYSVLALTMVLLGGAASSKGPIAGAVILIVASELLRFLPLADARIAYTRQALYGVILVSIVAWFPKGLFGQYDIRARRR